MSATASPAPDPAKRRGRFVDFTPSPEHYPFESKWFESSVGHVHYVDEGKGRPILLLHGNPDWSFLYRKMIKQLRADFRCIAPDYPGFGLSDHPDGYGYTSAEHARVVNELVDHLGLEDMIVMGQDWGGPIGSWIAAKDPDRVHGLVMGNTWCWPIRGVLFNVFARVMRSGPLQRRILERNLFVDPLMRRSLKKPISRDEFDHYLQTSPSAEFRRGFAEFPKQLLDAKNWLSALESDVRSKLRPKPILLTFGRKDPALGSRSIEARWRTMFPDNEVVVLPDAGHYIQEDAPDEIVRAIRRRFGTSA